MRLKRGVAAGGLFLVTAASNAKDPAAPPQWTERAAGVWEATVGAPERLTLSAKVQDSRPDPSRG